MKKYLFTVLLSLLLMGVGYGQTVLSEGFDSGMMPPVGWTVSSECTDCDPESWLGWVLDGWSHGGSYSAYVDYFYPSHSSYLITPLLSIADNMMLTFWVADNYPESTSATSLTVEISTSYPDPDYFTPLQTITLPTTGYEFEFAIVDLSAYVGQNVYIAFHVEDEFGTGVYIDDVTVGTPPECLPPSNLTTPYVGYNDMRVCWSPGSASSNSYTVQYAVAESDWADAVTLTTTDTTVLISSLLSAPFYEIRVKADCDSNGTSDWSDPLTVIMACEPITLMPDSLWLESFELAPPVGHLPLNTCWETPLMSSFYGTPGLYSGFPAAAHTGANSLELKGDYLDENMAVFPTFTNPLNQLRMNFFANTNASTLDEAGVLEIGYVTDPSDPTTFTLVEVIEIKNESLNRTSSAPYGPFYFLTAPDSARMAIHFTPSAYSISWNLDDIMVGLIAECMEPIYLKSTNISSSSADLSWLTAGEHTYDIFIWPSGTTDTTHYQGIAATDLPFTVDSLQPLTAYSWFARTICDDTTFIPSFMHGHFSTPDVSIELPYVQDFEGDPTEITEFTFSGTGNCQWYIGAATGVVDPDNPWATHSMYISDDGGLTNHYSGGNYSYAYASTQIQFPNDQMEYHLEFDYKLVGESGWDYFSVFLLDGGAALPTTGAPSGQQILSGLTNSGGWAHANVIIPNAVGSNKQIVFYWVNDNYIFQNPPVAVDNITISGNLCARPSVLSVQSLQSNSATLHWQENSGATAWTVHYKVVGSNDDFSEVVVNGNPTVTLTGLTSNTDYICFVTAFCDDTLQSQPSNPVIFRTSCSSEGITELPYVETFTSTVSLGSNAFDVFVPCWSRLQSNASHRAYVNTQDFESNCLDFHYTPGCYTIAALPPLGSEIPANSVMLTFDARRHNLATSALEVGVMTDPDVASTFQVIDTVEFSDTYTWESKIVYCHHYTGNGQYLAFRVNNAGNYTVAIDNLTVDYLPDCMPVENIQVSNIATNGATITWDGAMASSYEVYVAGATLNTYTTTTNSLTLNDLLPSSAYSVLVQSICGSESSVLAGPVVFETACGVITVTPGNPWEESFEHYQLNGANVVPLSDCWATPLYNSTEWGTYPGVVGDGQGVHSGVNSVEMYGSANMVVLPEFSNPLNTLRVSFWASASNYFAENTGTVALGYVTDASNPITFTPITIVPATALGYSGTDSPQADFCGPFDLMNVTAPAGARLAVRYTNTVTPYNSWHFDDFSVSVIPECTSPVKTSVTFTNITTTSADVSWIDEDSTHTQWGVHYRAVGDATWQMIPVYQQTTTLTDLTPNTTYQVHVITICDFPITVEDATNTVEFTTAMQAEEIPYTTDFSTSEGWHFNNGNYANYWTIGSPTPNSHALYITNNGVTAGYNVTERSIVSVEKLFTVGADPEFLVSFDVNVGGDYYNAYSTDFDYMKMFFAPASANYESDSPSNPTWSAADYSTYAYNFSTYMGYSLGGPSPFKFSLTGGNTVHIDAIVPNPNTNPNDYSLAKLVFAWVNDYTDGTQPGAVITNLSVSPVTCQQPTNMSVGNIGTSSATITWSGPSQTNWIFQYKHYYSSSWTTVPVTSHYCQLNGLSPNTLYYVRVAADCGDGETSIWSELSFKTHICEASEQCNYTVYMTDSYGDGWNGASLNILQNNTVLGTFTVNTGTNSQATIALCDSVPTTLSWSSGQYDNECTIYLYGPDGTQIYTNSNMSTSGPFYTFMSDCSAAGADCQAPIGLLASQITDTTAYFDWIIVGNEQSYVLAYTTDTTGTWTYDTVQFNFYDFVGLNLGTTYYVRVKANCAGDHQSDWSEVYSFSTGTTSVVDPLVVTQIAMDVTATSAVLNGAIVELGNQPILERGFEWRKTSDSVYTVTVLQSVDPILCDTLNDLTPSTFYAFRAFATTQYGTFYGQVRYFHTLEGITCEVPTNLDTVAVYNESITITWTDNADASHWKVRYREVGGDWITETVTATTFFITGLNGHTTYEIQVQAVCDEEDLSEWTPVLTVVTKDVGIPTWLESRVTLYPNPTHEVVNVQCTMYNVQLDGDIQLFDVYGKLLQIVPITSEITAINVSGLAAGMYFVRVTTGEGMVTKTFVKK